MKKTSVLLLAALFSVWANGALAGHSGEIYCITPGCGYKRSLVCGATFHSTKLGEPYDTTEYCQRCNDFVIVKTDNRYCPNCNSPTTGILRGPTASSYQLVKAPGEPKVYILKDGKKYPIQGAADFEALGLKWNDVEEVSSGQLNSYPEGPPINRSTRAQASKELLGRTLGGSQSTKWGSLHQISIPCPKCGNNTLRESIHLLFD
jgi:Zn finger protein HypA/HybF involved in hydrogenase expression